MRRRMTLVPPVDAAKLLPILEAQHARLAQEGLSFFGKRPDYMADQTRMVGTNDFWVTKPGEIYSRIGANSLVSGVAFAIHDPKHSVAGLVHAVTLIPSASGSPNHLESLCSRMFDIAAGSGGSEYNVTTFNVENGIRLPEQTRMATAIIQRVISSARANWKILSVTHRDEHNLILYSLDGSFYVAGT